MSRTALLLAGQMESTYTFTHRYSLEGHGFGIGDIVIGDGCEQLFFVFAIERRLTGEHLEQEHTVGPPIDTLAIFLIQNDLGGRRSMEITRHHAIERRKPPEQCNLETNEDRSDAAHESPLSVDPTWCTAESRCLFIVDDAFFTHSKTRQRHREGRLAD